MSYENVNFGREGRVALVTVNRPKVLNALNGKTFDDLEAIFKKIASDDSIGAVILTGANPFFGLIEDARSQRCTNNREALNPL